MKAIVLEAADRPLMLKDVEKPVAGKDEVVVRLKAAALNRRDYWISIGQYAGLRYPIIPGSDGAGMVSEIGPGADRHLLGKEVIINPAMNWGENEGFQGPAFSILGLPADGTLAEFVRVPASSVYPKPEHLSWEQAAALPLAGLTSYRALFRKGNARSGEKVLITGAGSGTGTFLIQWAVAAGCKVYVTSGADEKIRQATRMGALDGVNYHAEDWSAQLKKIAGNFDVIVDSALGDGFAEFTDLAAPGGRIVFFGGTAGNIPPLNGRKIFWKQLQLLGTTMGSPADFEDMLAFVGEHRIVPVVDQVFPLPDAPRAIERMRDAAQFGKIVLRPDGQEPYA